MSSLALSLLYGPTLTSVHEYWKKLFNMLSRLVIAFLLRSKCLLVSWPQSPYSEILEPQKMKSVTASTFSLCICHEVMWPDAMILVFWLLSFVSFFHLPLSSSSRYSLVPLSLLPLGWCHLPIWSCWFFSWQFWFQLVLHSAWYTSWCTLYIN